ncbi:MarR family winged helix-turn-helix transcriptional regulator [Jatrophihabitans sp. DSM 45814]
MSHASKSDGEAAAPVAGCGPDSSDAIGTVEQQFAVMMTSLARYQNQINGNRIDRMALMVLGVLSACGPSRLSAIAERTGFDPSTMSRQVADLEKAGLLSREPDPDDRRAIQLHATEAGVNLMQRLSDGRRRRMERLLGGWSHDDIVTFGRLLGQLNEATEKYGAQNAEEVEQELNHG